MATKKSVFGFATVEVITKSVIKERIQYLESGIESGKWNRDPEMRFKAIKAIAAFRWQLKHFDEHRTAVRATSTVSAATRTRKKTVSTANIDTTTVEGALAAAKDALLAKDAAIAALAVASAMADAALAHAVKVADATVLAVHEAVNAVSSVKGGKLETTKPAAKAKAAES